MVNVQIARLVANQLIFLEFCDEEEMHPDSALKVMEFFISDLEELDKKFLREVVDSFAVIAAEYEGETADFVRDIPHTFSLDEVLAADDPAELAKLVARRDEQEI